MDLDYLILCLTKEESGIQHNKKGVNVVYCCDCKISCFLGLLGIICTILQFIIICSLLFLIYNLIFKKICIEPVHHPDGDYRWAITKNGKPYKWFKKKKKIKNDENK
jgi:hypothetical protein